MRSRSRGVLPEFFRDVLPPNGRRARGTPDAGRTREPCVQREVHFAHASNDRAAETTGVPCAMVLTAAPRSPRCAGLFSHRHRRITRRLDTSVGAPGPHGLTVRLAAHRLAQLKRPSQPAPTFVAIARAPLLVEQDARTIKLMRPSGKAKYFSREGLTRFRKIGATGKSVAKLLGLSVKLVVPGR
jgi:hypothetical protein